MFNSSSDQLNISDKMGITDMIFSYYNFDEKRSRASVPFMVLLIGILCLQLASCAGTPRRYLTLDASLIKKGESKTRVLKMLGPPDARRTNDAGQEEWYYYSVHRHFWQRIPMLGRYLGKEDVEALQVTFQTDKVLKVVYYVPRK